MTMCNNVCRGKKYIGLLASIFITGRLGWAWRASMPEGGGAGGRTHSDWTMGKDFLGGRQMKNGPWGFKRGQMTLTFAFAACSYSRRF